MQKIYKFLIPLFFASCEAPYVSSKQTIAMCNVQIDRNATYSEIIFCPELAGLEVFANIYSTSTLKLTILGEILAEPTEMTPQILTISNYTTDTNLTSYFITPLTIGETTLIIRRGTIENPQDVLLNIGIFGQ